MSVIFNVCYLKKYFQMKSLGYFSALILLFSLAGCFGPDKTKILSQYKYEDNPNSLTVNVKTKLEPWIKQGVECYGIIMVCDLSGNPLRIKEVRVKVSSIQPDNIKMEAQEDVIINRTIECKKISFKKGDSWNEEYGDIFRTREEAIKYIDKNYPGLRIKN